MDVINKINLLKIIANEFNEAGVTWSLGGSMLLYFKGITKEFNDIDILIIDKDVLKVKKIMTKLKAELQPFTPKTKYKTKIFLEYKISGIDLDIMAGFTIVNNGIDYDCSLKPNQIIEYYDLDGEKIPLQSIDLWLKYYKLMGRESKVSMIENAYMRLILKRLLFQKW